MAIRTGWSLASCAAVASLLAGCGSNAHLVEDVTDKCGIDFRHTLGHDVPNFFMPHSIGSGAAFLDFDNDGNLDIYLLQIGGPGSGMTNRLYG